MTTSAGDEAELFWEKHYGTRRTAPWSWNQDAYYPTPSEIAAELDLDPERWPVLRADMPRRQATGPAGETATVTDNILVLRRTAG